MSEPWWTWEWSRCRLLQSASGRPGAASTPDPAPAWRGRVLFDEPRARADELLDRRTSGCGAVATVCRDRPQRAFQPLQFGDLAMHLVEMFEQDVLDPGARRRSAVRCAKHVSDLRQMEAHSVCIADELQPFQIGSAAQALAGYGAGRLGQKPYSFVAAVRFDIALSHRRQAPDSERRCLWLVHPPLSHLVTFPCSSYRVHHGMSCAVRTIIDGPAQARDRLVRRRGSRCRPESDAVVEGSRLWGLGGRPEQSGRSR